MVAGKLAEKLKPVFTLVEPTVYARHIDPSRVLVMDALYDELIPKTARDALWISLGKPDRITFLYGHKTSFLAMTPLVLFWTINGEILSFFEEHL